MNELPAEQVLLDERKVVYAVPQGKRALIKSIKVVNNAAFVAYVNVYVNAHGQSRRICQRDLELPEGGIGIEDSLLDLKSGDTIEAHATPDGVVSVMVFGEET